MNIKSEGSFYTPTVLANFLMSESLSFFHDTEGISILEPSCGDGVFLAALLEDKKGAKNVNSIYAVEKNMKELKKAKTTRKELIDNGIIPSYFVADFLNFKPKGSTKFELIIGNPPYIHKKHLSSEQIEQSKEILELKGIKNTSISNIWISFVVKAIDMLKDNGVLCYILPSEMLQVKYAKEIRRLLFCEFDEITFLTFSEKIFTDIEQDVIVLICKRKSENKVIKHGSLTRERDSFKIEYRTISPKSYFQDKWLWYLLKQEEVASIKKILDQFTKINDLCESGAGIVTGNNDYFIVSKSSIKKYGLQKYCKPILKKSFFIKDTIIIRENEFRKISDKELPCYLIDLNRIKSNRMPKRIKEYIAKGELEDVHKGYKCNIRPEWYKVPSIWSSEGVFFKRSHLYPKILYNECGAFITDTGYRIKMKESVSIKNLVFCFYNSLTLLLAELNGRNYGGGVLEVTPKEFQNLRLPFYDAGEILFEQLQQRFSSGVPIEDILDFTDRVILHQQFDISMETIQMIKNVRKTLLINRLPNGYNSPE
ncbi:N-6 DNA methylase [Brevibacillus sp. AG]|uniref:Eco57I restriction-modification methylase domain-containing protein n=1 Tax=Brevibacillus sp. AG TaxID=3020891 RepID=UPI00232E3D6F|nr:N-6 DNA methylase [Brevibacillus sp. AG]MDC0764748.1 N-6 DNA methylase [Brevibacillus sp. AG]